jgi:hypothetical protein
MHVQGPARLDWPYIKEWRGKHETLDLLAEAKADAAFAWENECPPDFPGCTSIIRWHAARLARTPVL